MLDTKINRNVLCHAPYKIWFNKRCVSKCFQKIVHARYENKTALFHFILRDCFGRRFKNQSLTDVFHPGLVITQGREGVAKVVDGSKE